MTAISYVEPELIIALNRKVIFVYPNDLQIFKEVELPEDLTKCGLKSEDDTREDDSEAAAKTKKKAASPPEKPSVQNVCLSPDGLTLAVTTAGQKALLLFKCWPVHAKLVAVRALARASSALAFASDSKSILVTDKTGDCYQYDCVDLEAKPRLLFGHLSIVYDVLWTPDAKYIISCDRDDKIRVTNYPATHDIHGYCLGHKEFVSGLAWLEAQVIASVSGDGTLRVWNFESGQQLAKLELPAPGIRLAVRTLEANKFQAAVLLHQPNECVGIYEIAKSATGDWTLSLAEGSTSLLSFPAMIVSNLCFAGERLYVTGVVDEHFAMESALGAAPPENWLQMVKTQFEQETWRPEDVSAWFKKRFDNVSDYLERKRRRIEEKEKK